MTTTGSVWCGAEKAITTPVTKRTTADSERCRPPAPGAPAHLGRAVRSSSLGFHVSMTPNTLWRMTVERRAGHASSAPAADALMIVFENGRAARRVGALQVPEKVLVHLLEGECLLDHHAAVVLDHEVRQFWPVDED